MHQPYRHPLRHPASIAGILLALTCFACAQPEENASADGNPTGALSGAADADVRWVDRAAQLGIDFVTVVGNQEKSLILEANGSGVAVADYDGDGLKDIYLGTAQTRDDWLAGRRPRANALYRAAGDGTYRNVAAEAGVDLAAWTSGTYFVDVDDDGDKDLFVTCWGANVLYRNDGGRFTDVTDRSGLGQSSRWSSSAAFGDLDGDGDLDLYVANYTEYDMANPPFGGAMVTWKGIEVMMGPKGLVGEPDRLYRNDGGLRFTDVTTEAGIDDETNPYFGLGVILSDLDNDGDVDIYVANDTNPNYLWRNDGGMRFVEIASLAGVAANEDARYQAGMGVDVGDYDGDGLFDLFVTNFSHEFNTLYRNRGGMIFVDMTFQARFADSFAALVWGTKFLDFDNDGRLDLFVANGHVYPIVDQHAQLATSYRQRNAIYRNRGDGTFDNVTAAAGPGMQILESTRGVATADLDDDGDPDLVLTNQDAAVNVLINEGGNRRPWVAFDLEGTRSNRDGINARLELHTGERVQLREVNPFGSYMSQSDYTVLFGLGDAERVDRVTIHWPSGAVDTLAGLEARQRYRVVEGSGSAEVAGGNAP